MSQIEKLLRNTASILNSLESNWALIGGLAVSVRAEPRFTRDIDIAIAVDDDVEAEKFVYKLKDFDLVTETLIEQEAMNRLATVRCTAAGGNFTGVVVDFLFASSGIEPEITKSADLIEVFPELTIPVAKVGHLLALKLLSTKDTRPQDNIDLISLLEIATTQDIATAKDCVNLIQERGFSRDKDLLTEFNTLIKRQS